MSTQEETQDMQKTQRHRLEILRVLGHRRPR